MRRGHQKRVFNTDSLDLHPKKRLQSLSQMESLDIDAHPTLTLTRSYHLTTLGGTFESTALTCALTTLSHGEVFSRYCPQPQQCFPEFPDWKGLCVQAVLSNEQRVQGHGFDSPLCFTQSIKLTVCDQDCTVLFFFVRSVLGTLRKGKKGRGKNSGCLYSSQRIIQLNNRDVAIKCPLVAGRALRDRE